jgi:hypothetical protein
MADGCEVTEEGDALRDVGVPTGQNFISALSIRVMFLSERVIML